MICASRTRSSRFGTASNPASAASPRVRSLRPSRQVSTRKSVGTQHRPDRMPHVAGAENTDRL